MRILIAEDDMTSRLFMKKYLSQYGVCDIAMNGMEAIDLVTDALSKNAPYDLICLDIMMPKVDGITVLKVLREMERGTPGEGKKAAKIVMTTALYNKETVDEAYGLGCDAYAPKPVDTVKFTGLLSGLKLI